MFARLNCKKFLNVILFSGLYFCIVLRMRVDPLVGGAEPRSPFERADAHFEPRTAPSQLQIEAQTQPARRKAYGNPRRAVCMWKK